MLFLDDIKYLVDFPIGSFKVLDMVSWFGNMIVDDRVVDARLVMMMIMAAAAVRAMAVISVCCATAAHFNSYSLILTQL